jgi:hypothetical protein
MSAAGDVPPAPAPRRAARLWQSGLIFAAASFVTGLGNFAFQAIFSRHLGQSGEYGLANSALKFTGFLSLPLAIATYAVTHYIARFNFSGDDARLHNLLAGCRRFLFRLTLGGSVLALVLVKPLAVFFHFPRPGLLLVVVACVWAGLWGAFATALCQGLAWFKRLALIGLLTMCLRVAFGGLITLKIPTAEMVVLASGVGFLANLILLLWKKDLMHRSAQPESPWNREFIRFLVVAAACVGGGFCFTQADVLVANKYFSRPDLDAYTATQLLAAALPMTVGPLLTVLFTHRSGDPAGESAGEQFKLLGLYAAGLVAGATGLLLTGTVLLKILARNTPEAVAMLRPLTVTMMFSGLLQALALWSLASRWQKISLLYGGLGLAYWLVLLGAGTTPQRLLHVMPWSAGLAFAVLFVAWGSALRARSERQ